MTSCALYRDPRLYDLEYAGKSDDVVYYSRLAAQAGGPVLELACGNGRLTLPMARTGAQITGIDNEPSMLRDLQTKLALEPLAVRRRVRHKLGDMRTIDEDQLYDLVVLPFNAIHHCRDHRDFIDVMRGVRAVLRPGARFVLDCYLPDPALYRRDPDRRYEERDFIDPRTGGQLTSWEQGWYDPISQVHHVIYIYRDHVGVETRAELNLRMFYPQELHALFDWAGFVVEHQHTDFEGAPLDAQSLKAVYTLRPASSR